MGTGHHGLPAAGLVHGAVEHFVGHGAGKEDQQIGRTDFVSQSAAHFCENLGTAAVFFAEVFVLALHTLISADDDNAHLGQLLSNLVSIR